MDEWRVWKLLSQNNEHLMVSSLKLNYSDLGWGGCAQDMARWFFDLAKLKNKILRIKYQIQSKIKKIVNEIQIFKK